MGTLGENVKFSINKYDRDGDVYDAGIFLHFGETCIKVAEDFEEYKRFLLQLNGMTAEIEENVGWAL